MAGEEVGDVGLFNTYSLVGGGRAIRRVAVHLRETTLARSIRLRGRALRTRTARPVRGSWCLENHSAVSLQEERVFHSDIRQKMNKILN